jgi:carbamate kinase
VQIGFRSSHPVDLKKVSLREIKMHFERGEFPPGSMGPKIAAAIQFLESGGERVIITSPKQFGKALFDGFGTHIIH